MIYSKIAGTGSYLPEKILSNHDLELMVETSDQWITERTGIKQRHIAADNETTTDLAYHAAVNAIDAANISADDIDLIIVATTTPTLVFPSTAALVQEKLGITTSCPVFDVQAVCTGFVYALTVADKFIKSGGYNNVLVIGAETNSRITDWTDRNTCVLFGDGAGAVVLQPSAEAGILSTHIHADGSYHRLLQVPTGPGSSENELDSPYIHMQGNEVFKIAVKTLSLIVDETLAANQMNKEDIDWLIPHQANIRIIAATARKLHMSMDRVVVTVDKHGNTSAASIPLALDAAVRDGRVKRGETILLEAFGGGFTWGSALIRY